MHIKQVVSGIASRMNMDDHTMKAIEGKGASSLQAAMVNRLDGIHTRITSSLCPWGELGLSHTIEKGILWIFWFVEVGAFLPSATPEGLLLSGSWNLEVVSNHYLNHQEGLLLLFSFPSFFSVSSSSRCGSRLFRRSALISEPVHNLSQCLFFSFDWLNHIQLWSLTNQKFLFFWLIHFLYQEIWKRTSVLSCLNLTWFSVFFSFNL